MSCLFVPGARLRHRLRSLGVVSALVLTPASFALSQFGAPPAAGTPAAKPADGKPAIIERAPLILRDNSRFQIPLKLDAAKSIHVAARVDGVVATVLTKLGDRVQAQAEVARLEAQERQMELPRPRPASAPPRLSGPSTPETPQPSPKPASKRRKPPLNSRPSASTSACCDRRCQES
jgi:hypothetical protein